MSAAARSSPTPSASPSVSDGRPAPLPALLQALHSRDMPALAALLADPGTRAELNLNLPGPEFPDPGQTPLLWAIDLKWGAAAEALLLAGADPNFSGGGRVPLFEAIARKDGETVDRLIAAGADLDIVDRDSNTALHVAATSAPGLMSELLARRACWPLIDSRNRTDSTALRLAAATCGFEAMDALAKAGADLDAAMKGGHTALTQAADFGAAPSLERLIALGADLDHRTSAGFSALDHALFANSASAAAALMDAGVDPRKAPPGALSAEKRALDIRHHPHSAAMEILARAKMLDERDALDSDIQAEPGFKPRRAPGL